MYKSSSYYKRLRAEFKKDYRRGISIVRVEDVRKACLSGKKFVFQGRMTRADWLSLVGLAIVSLPIGYGQFLGAFSEDPSSMFLLNVVFPVVFASLMVFLGIMWWIGVRRLCLVIDRRGVCIQGLMGGYHDRFFDWNSVTSMLFWAERDGQRSVVVYPWESPHTRSAGFQNWSVTLYFARIAPFTIQLGHFGLHPLRKPYQGPLACALLALCRGQGELSSRKNPSTSNLARQACAQDLQEALVLKQNRELNSEPLIRVEQADDACAGGQRFVFSLPTKKKTFLAIFFGGGAVGLSYLGIILVTKSLDSPVIAGYAWVICYLAGLCIALTFLLMIARIGNILILGPSGVLRRNWDWERGRRIGICWTWQDIHQIYDLVNNLTGGFVIDDPETQRAKIEVCLTRCFSAWKIILNPDPQARITSVDELQEIVHWNQHCINLNQLRGAIIPGKFRQFILSRLFHTFHAQATGLSKDPNPNK